MQLTITSTRPSRPSESFELQLIGSIDLSTRDSLITAAADALTTCTDVDIDCTGLEALMEIGRIAAREQCTVRLSHRSRQLDHVLTLTGLNGVWCGEPAAHQNAPGPDGTV